VWRRMWRWRWIVKWCVWIEMMHGSIGELGCVRVLGLVLQNPKRGGM
jgi:hypothetical protein